MTTLPATFVYDDDVVLEIEWDRRALTLLRAGKVVLRGELGVGLKGTPSTYIEQEEWWRWQFSWENGAVLTIELISPEIPGFVLAWDNPPEILPEDRFELASGGHWYGGAELVRQHWPLETLRWEMAPYIVTDNGPAGLGNVLHPIWITSSGVTITVDPLLAIDVGLNAPREAPPPRVWPMGIEGTPPALFPLVDTEHEGDGCFRLRGQVRVASELRSDRYDEGRALLLYTLSAHANPVKAQQVGFSGFYSCPRSTPPPTMFEAPIWTTWARYKMSINQKWVLQFADEIVAHDFPRSIMEIDDKWSSGYGELEFDPVKFPDPKAMVEQLHKLGFLVTLWVMPFAAPGTAAFEEGQQRGYWVKNAESEPGFFRWWQGQGVALDVTNEEAVAWYLARLRSLQARYGIDGFKFDAGEPCFLPENFRTSQPINPNEYTTLWVERVAAQFPLMEVRSAYDNQHLPIVVREWDRFSTWGLDNGLQSIVTTALTLGVLGYPFILPDMIGGNAYGEHRPNKELMIRWAQANALMPAMQFSIAPWDFDEETVELCRRAVEWHRQVVPVILQLAEEATKTGYPILRPLFWLAPDDAETYAIGNQFALGQDIVVAPVMEEGVTARDLYLPAGQWRDVLRGDIVEGGRWLRGYPAGLDHLPWFERTVSLGGAPGVSYRLSVPYGRSISFRGRWARAASASGSLGVIIASRM